MKKLLLALALSSAAFLGSVDAKAGAEQILALGRTNQYTFDVLQNAEVANAVSNALLEEFKYLTATATPSEVLGDRFLFASGCEPHNCPNTKAFVIDAYDPRAVVILRSPDLSADSITHYSTEAWNNAYGWDRSRWPYLVRAAIDRWVR